MTVTSSDPDIVRLGGEIALANNNIAHAQQALQRVEDGIEKVNHSLSGLNDRMLRMESDPLSFPAGKALSNRVDENSAAIEQLQGLVNQGRGSIRTLKAATSVVGLIASVAGVLAFLVSLRPIP